MRKKELTEELEKLGLSAEQAELYIAGLKLGASLLAPLAKEAHIPRTSAYALIEQLERERLFNTIPSGRRILHQAAAPTQLLKRVLDQEHIVRELLPFLESLTPKPLDASTSRDNKRQLTIDL